MFVRTLSVLFFTSISFASPYVEKASFDFGSVFQGETVEASFKIENRGESPISIQKITAPCGCTVASGEGPINLGDSREVDVKVSTDLFSGRITKTATVLTSDLSTPEIVLSVSGEVRGVGKISPEVINFGVLESGERYKTRLKVSPSPGFKLDAIRTSSQFINISPDGEIVVTPPVGEFRDRLLVSFKSRDETIIKNVPVYGRVQPSVRAEPQVVSFGLVNGPVSRSVEIFTSSPIESIESGEVQVVRLDDKLLKFTIQGLSKDLKSSVTVRFEDGNKLEIPVYGVSP